VKLYLIERNDHVDWDEYESALVRAENYNEAKKQALFTKDKTHKWFATYPGFTESNITITELTIDGEPGHIIGNVNQG